MSAKCAITGKKPVSGNNVSHAHNKTKRLFKPNLQKATLLVNGARRKVNVSASALRTLEKKGRMVNAEGDVFEML
jgi:large subunit ribosomal protein L28